MGQQSTLQKIPRDPLAESPLTLQQTFYPIGFPVDIRANRAAVLEAAAESWGSFPAEFERAPVRIHVAVHAGGSDPAPEPVYRLERGLMLIVSGRDDFAFCDLRSRFGWCRISSNMLADRGWFRWFFLEAMAYLLLNQEDVVSIHAACVERNGRGVLLCGASGGGKSTLAYACARAGWTYLSDDATILLQGSGSREVLGRPNQFRFRPEAMDLFPEIAGHSASIKPNGKPTVEVPVRAFPRISTASRSRIERIVFLKRRRGPGVQARPVSAADALERMMNELPVYSEEVSRRHRHTVSALVAAPACQLEYAHFDHAIPLLARLVDES